MIFKFQAKKQTTTKFEIQFSIFRKKLCETKNSPGVELIWYLKLSQNINKQSEQKLAWRKNSQWIVNKLNAFEVKSANYSNQNWININEFGKSSKVNVVPKQEFDQFKHFKKKIHNNIDLFTYLAIQNISRKRNIHLNYFAIRLIDQFLFMHFV